MLLNLWDNSELALKFMELYNVVGIQMCNILKRLHLDAEQDNIEIFCEETGIKLDTIAVTHDVELLGKIISTTTDNFTYLRQTGLVSLDILLENNSPISQHLKKYQIEIKPSTHELFYKGKRFNIPSYGEECECCVYGDMQCKFSHKRYKDMYCSYLKAIRPLAIKLYSDNSEIEMFLSAPKEDMLECSTVKRYPEIFVTVTNFVKDFFGKQLSIGAEWEKIKQNSHIINIPVKYDHMSYRSNYIDSNNGKDANNILSRYGHLCAETYDCIEQVPKCFWDNIWLITVCLDLIREFGETRESIYAGIKHDVHIPYDNLHIELI